MLNSPRHFSPPLYPFLLSSHFASSAALHQRPLLFPQSYKQTINKLSTCATQFNRPGIIPRAMSQLFHEARRPPPVYPGFRVPALKTTFRVSFVEIYNEDLIDLLVKGEFRPPVSIREDAKGNIYWTGVQEIVVSSVEEVIQYAIGLRVH